MNKKYDSFEAMVRSDSFWFPICSPAGSHRKCEVRHFDSVEGLTLKTLNFESLYSDQFTLYRLTIRCQRKELYSSHRCSTTVTVETSSFVLYEKHCSAALWLPQTSSEGRVFDFMRFAHSLCGCRSDCSISCPTMLSIFSPS